MLHQHARQSSRQSFEMERKYSVPSNPDSRSQIMSGSASEDLHAWSIYRQNLNSDFTDSALGSTDKSPLPYGNFQLRDTTVQSILSHPRYGPKSALGSNMYTYLKFGLPRVFPPNHNGSNRSGTPQHFQRNTAHRPQARGMKGMNRGLREGSSGYDSSDNETAQQYKHNRKYRSDPDFRMQNVHPSYKSGMPPTHFNIQHNAAKMQNHSGVPLAAMQTANRPGNWNRNRSISEANLLASDLYGRPPYNVPHNNNVNNRRNSIAEFGHEIVDHGFRDLGRPMSKAESHLSLSRRGPSVIRGDYLAHEQDLTPTFIYPHLQARALELRNPKRKGMLLLQNVSFEIRGGEIMAIMATSDAEGTGLLDAIAGVRSPVGGDIILNGQNVSKRALSARVAYVQDDPHLWSDLTAQQILRFHYDLKKPTDKLGHLKIDALDRINVLIEDLGLEQVRHSKVSSMTTSERLRLNVAAHLLLDTDIVVLDQPTRGMDIFDTFFLVEYLRQWANGGSGNAVGRIVILTLHPPTYEIFTMLSRVVLLSAGRTMFSGRRRDMLPYFSMVEYPCPSYKNPSDYYLDLVTLDDLSAEAMLESSQRIEQLADIFRRKQEPLSDPGPPTTLPMTVRSSNPIKQAIVLFTKSMFYTQPSTFMSWMWLFLFAALLSIMTGAVFWDVPGTDPQLGLNDRIGYHYAVMCVTPWPLLLTLTLGEIRRNRRHVTRDVNDGLYGRFTYVFTKIIFNLPPSLLIWLVYLVPSYSMSGLYMQGPANYDGFYVYLGYMVLYLSCLQIFFTAAAHVVPTKPGIATMIGGLIVGFFCLLGGYSLHRRDLDIAEWPSLASPMAWLLPLLAKREHTVQAIASSSITTLCRNKQVQHQDIIVQLPCPPPNGTQVLINQGLWSSDKPNWVQDNVAPTMGILYVAFFAVACFGFALFHRQRNYRNRRSGANKP